MKSKIIGLTGGIGSGKSTIAKIFKEKGFPVYIADERAKIIMKKPATISKIVKAFGTDILDDGIVDRKKLAKIAFENKNQLEILNSIVHPLVHDDFQDWLADNKDQQFVIKESAILFETGGDKLCYKTIAVSAPISVRIERVMKRDNISREEVLLRIGTQLTDDVRESKSDFVINNINLNTSKIAVANIILAIK